VCVCRYMKGLPVLVRGLACVFVCCVLCLHILVCVRVCVGT